jgi:hypothetical protein
MDNSAWMMAQGAGESPPLHTLPLPAGASSWLTTMKISQN